MEKHVSFSSTWDKKEKEIKRPAGRPPRRKRPVNSSRCRPGGRVKLALKSFKKGEKVLQEQRDLPHAKVLAPQGAGRKDHLDIEIVSKEGGLEKELARRLLNGERGKRRCLPVKEEDIS